jgi:omega-hydroxy-beta-dihydromenaquinone-9 sulfotransferase
MPTTNRFPRIPVVVRITLYALAFLALVLVVLPRLACRFDEYLPRWHVELPLPLRLAGAVLFIAALAAYLYCTWQLTRRGRGAYVEFDPPTQFVAEGPYRWCRNPIAGSVVVMLAALAVAMSSSGVALLFLVSMPLAHAQVVFLEEPLLRRRFGDPYAAYTQHVPRWIPRPPDDARHPGYRDHFWIPRFWAGMCPRGWISLLARNQFDVSPWRLPHALHILALSLCTGVLWLVQEVLLGWKIRRTPLKEDPIFVIGHWRAGTTLLHELLTLDPRYGCADTYACFAPNHFLVSGWFVRPLMKILLPRRRPMDNMAAGWNRPQEDEFALCNMGLRSPYLTLAFPNHPPQDQEYLDLRNVPPAARARWKRGLSWFLRCVTLRHPRRLVLKSPAHTCRIRTLLELFPNAKFVHIVRHPFAMFPSTVNLWKRLYADQGLHKPLFHGLEELVLATLTRMYEAFDEDRRLLAPDQLCTVRYEDLIADPPARMQWIYATLNLGEFDRAAPAIAAYFAQRRDYQTNQFEITPALRCELISRWSKYFNDYGYSSQDAPPTSSAPVPAP